MNSYRLMERRVECCVNNVTADARAVLDETVHEVRFSFCLDHCGTCYEEPFLVVDGELRTGRSHEDILRRTVTKRGEGEWTSSSSR